MDLTTTLCKLRGLAKVYEARECALSREDDVVTASFTFPNRAIADAFRHRALLEAQHFSPVAPIYGEGNTWWVDVSLFPPEPKPYDSAVDWAELEADHAKDVRP
jgi:hypothetical protein